MPAQALPKPDRQRVQSLASLLADLRGCTRCHQHLPLGPKPIVQLHPAARILIAAQAPGRKAHDSGIPFDDASGERLRAWLGMSRETFYDAKKVAILPMGFCFPGTGKSGDQPPRSECAPAWRAALLAHLKKLRLTLVIGQYAKAYHLPEPVSVTDAVRNWRQHWPHTVALPHPSPRNNLWLKRNPWFEAELLPQIRARVLEALGEEPAGQAVQRAGK